MRPIRVFLDSDVIISSLLSSTGAARFLVNKNSLIKFISNFSVKEIHIVAKRLNIKTAAVDQLIRCLKIVHLKQDFGKNYVTDRHDSHIVSGVVTAKTKFLLTYNLKHFKIDRIKRDYGILVYRPAQFLQYLRSL